MFIWNCYPKNHNELYGEYFAEYSVAKETLTIKAGGTFRQEVIFKGNNQTDLSEGKWQYKSDKGYILFDEHYMSILNGFGELNPDYKKPLKDSTSYLPVGKYFRCISIGTAENVLYLKKNKYSNFCVNKIFE